MWFALKLEPPAVSTAADVTDTVILALIVRKLDAMASIGLYRSTQVACSRLVEALEDVGLVDAVGIMHLTFNLEFILREDYEFQLEADIIGEFTDELLQVCAPDKPLLNLTINKPKSYSKSEANPDNLVLHIIDLEDHKPAINSPMGVQRIVVVEHKDE